MPIDEWNRFGAMLRSYSNDPETARNGLLSLKEIDDQENEIKLAKQKATDAKQGVFQKLLLTGAANGADESVLQKLAMAGGIDAGGVGLSGLGKPKVDPIEARRLAAAQLIDKVEPASLDEYVQTGEFSRLKPLANAGKPSVVNPQSALVDATGKVIYENKNVRPTSGNKTRVLSPGAILTDEAGNQIAANTNPRSTAGGYRAQVRADVLKRNEGLRTQIGGSDKLSDRLKLARARIDENVASGITTPSTGDKIKGDLDKRREVLVRYDNSADRMMGILDKNPTAATVGADVAKSALAAASNLKGLLNLIPGADLTDVDLDETDWSAQLTKIAGDNNELRTTMFNMAIQKAVADGLAGGKFTNQQISMALDNIGAGGRTPAAIRRKLKEIRKEVAGSLDLALDGALEDYSSLDRPDPTSAKPTKEDAIAELRRRGLVK